MQGNGSGSQGDTKTHTKHRKNGQSKEHKTHARDRCLWGKCVLKRLNLNTEEQEEDWTWKWLELERACRIMVEHCTVTVTGIFDPGHMDP